MTSGSKTPFFFVILFSAIAMAIFFWPGYGYQSYLDAKKKFKDLPGFSPTKYSDDCTHWFGSSSTYFDFLRLPRKDLGKETPSHSFFETEMNGEKIYMMGSNRLPYDIINKSNFLIYDKDQFLSFDPKTVSLIKITNRNPDLNGENFASRLVLFGMNQMNQSGLSYNLSFSESGKVSLVAIGQNMAFGCSLEKECSFLGKDKEQEKEKYWSTFKKDDILAQVRTMCSRVQGLDIRAMLDDYRSSKVTCDTPEQIQNISTAYDHALEKCTSFDKDIVPLVDKFFSNK